MRSQRSQEHEEAVSRRMALLTAELAAVRPATRAPDDPDADAADANPWRAPASHTRVSAERQQALGWHRSDEVAPPRADPPVGLRLAPPPIPAPGRHARRRLGPPVDGGGSTVPTSASWRPGEWAAARWGLPRWVPRCALGGRQLAVVALVVALGLTLTAWWLARGAPREVVAPAAPLPVTPPVSSLPSAGPGPAAAGDVAGPGPAAGAAGASVAAPPGAAAELVVDVAGKVRRPGIAVLAAGSRVVDAIEAAGGARAGVDLSSLNLARPLVDGEQILVGIQPATGVAAGAVSGIPPPASAGGEGAMPGGALVPLNSADQVQLESLPDVGPVTAQAILSWRTEHGSFTSIDELLEVDGIGEATLARLAPLVTL